MSGFYSTRFLDEHRLRRFASNLPLAVGVVTTWNPADKGAAVTLSGGNLIATGATSGAFVDMSVRATAGKASGKHYFEVRLDVTNASNFKMVGICTSAALMTGGFHVHSLAYAYYEETGQKWNNNVGAAYGAAYVATDVIGVAFDATAGTIEFYKNNVSQGVAFTGIPADTYFPALAFYGQTPAPQFTGRFKTADFTYTPPTGYSAWGV